MTVRRRKLTVKQEAFRKEFLSNGRKGPAAYRHAFNAANMSPGAVNTEVQRLLKHPLIALSIQEITEKAQEDSLLTVKMLDQQTARIAAFDARMLYRDDGSLLPVSEWPDDAAAALSGLDVYEERRGEGEARKIEGYTKKVRFLNRLEAIQLGYRRLGALRDNITINGGIKVEHKFVFEEIGDNGKVIEGHAIKEPSAA